MARRTAKSGSKTAATTASVSAAAERLAAMARRLTTMASMQHRHNLRVHPQWTRQGHDYYRAVWVECAELLDHYGWKWWKRHEANLEQVKLEIVDIWHFGLSELIRARAVWPVPEVDESSILLAVRLQAALDRPPPADFRAAVETLATSCLSTREFDLDAFAGVLQALPLGFDELYEMYVAKNVLNVFRQEHGYGSGEYRKVWNGREDNEHLAELMRGMDTAAKGFPADLAEALAARYAATGPN